MLDMGFMPDIRRILDLLAEPQADAPVLGDVLRRHQAARRARSCNDPETIEVARHGTAAETVRQLVYPVDRDRKEELLAPPRASRATGTRCSCSPGPSSRPRGSPRGSTATASPSTAIHSDRAQSDRTKALEAFKAGRDPGPRGDRRRGPRPRHRGPAPRRELRAAVEPRGLRPPHRADGSRRARPATRSASCASTRRTCCAASSGCSSGRSRGRSPTGFEPQPGPEAQPLRAPRGAARRAPRTASGSGPSGRGPRPGRRGGSRRAGAARRSPTAPPTRAAAPAELVAGLHRRRQDHVEQRCGDHAPGPYALWFVRTAIVTPVRRAGSGRRSGSPRIPTRVAERRAGPRSARPGSPGRRGSGAELALVYRASREHLRRYVAGESTSPPAHARIQRAASVAVAAIEPAPPAAVTTDRNGITSLPGATGLSRVRRSPSASRPVAAAPSALRLLGPLVPRRVERRAGRAAGRGPPRRAGRPVTCSTSSPSSR